MLNRWRRTVYTVIEAGGSGRAARIFDDFMVVLIVLNVIAVILESVPSIEAPFTREFKLFDIISVSIFAMEYAARIWASIEIPAVRQRGPFRGRLMFASRPSQIIDFLAFAPAVLSFIFPGIDLRFIRVFRLLRFLKQHSTWVFVWYRLAFGAAILLALATDRLSNP